MPQSIQFDCPQGHLWEVELTDSVGADCSTSICPMCGAPGKSWTTEESVGTTDQEDELPPPPLETKSAMEMGEGQAGAARTIVSARGHFAGAAPRIAGYEILGELGRGGMGVVYHARQESLGREVALKIILAGSHAGWSERSRFRVEAETAARLKHPNIVTIYEVGEQDGRPYLALEFVEGGSLAEQLAVSPLAPAKAAALAETLARAMEHVHQHGIVHRDLKPANVLLAAGGVPKITDFGLAKWLDVPSGHSHSGAILGTPSYMAPEQARGESKLAGPATDIYALGAILYEMVTGRPPFHAATPQETVQQMLTEEPVPPSRLQPLVLRDLETICLKCLQKEPARRYASGGALADDLRRFLAREPILARRTPSWERVGKWTRRRPAVAMLIGVCVAAAVAFLAIVLAYNTRLRRERAIADAQKNAAKLAQQRAEDNFRMAIDAVDRFYTKISEEQLLNVPRMAPLREQLLQSAVEFYERFVRERGQDPTTRVDLGRAYQALSQFTRKSRSKTDAIQLLGQAIAIQEELDRAHPDDPVFRSDLAVSRTNLGGLYGETGQMDRSAEQFRNVLPLWEDLVRRYPSNGAYREHLGHAWYSLGMACSYVGRHDEAKRAHARSRTVLEELVRDEPKVAGHRSELAMTIHAQGELAVGAGALAEAAAAFREAIVLREVLARENPDRLAFRSDLADSHRTLAVVARMNGELDRAEASNKDALAIYQNLAIEHPDISAYQIALARSYHELGIIYYTARKDRIRSEESLRKAVETLEAVTRDHPEVPDYQSDLVRAYLDLGEIYFETSQQAQAEASYSKGSKILERLVGAHPDVIGYQADLGLAYALQGQALARSGKPRDVFDRYGKAIDALEAALGRQAANAAARQYLGFAYRGRGDAYGGLGQTAEAVRDWDKAIPLCEGEERTLARLSRARALARLGEHERAAAAAEEVAGAKSATASDLYRSAGVYAAAVASLRDATANRAGAGAPAERYAARALSLLSAAQAAGYFNDPDRLAAFRKDRSLDPLRARADFKTWAARLGPASPPDSGPPGRRP